jgi:pimeloyl-ACP methyl ester carboxylesterase
MKHLYRTERGARLIENQYREFLKFWPVANRRLRIPTRLGETFGISCGADNAPALLLLHGGGSNSAIWMGDATAWARHFRVYAIDLIGEPGLSAPSRPPLHSDAYALWLDDILQALALDSVAIVGVSFGGWVALDYASRRPSRVNRLVLLAPGGVGRQRRSFIFKILPLLMLGNWGRRKALRIAIGAPPANPPPGYRKFLDYMTLVQQQFRARMELLPIHSDAALKTLKMPVLTIVGGNDAILDSAETKKRMELNIPHAHVRYLPELGHGILGERAAILEFLL